MSNRQCHRRAGLPAGSPDRPSLRALPALLAGLGVAGAAHAQPHAAQELSRFETLFGLAELPFLFLAVFFALATASVLKGGTFGRGMRLIAWGFLVMAVGHLHMVVNHLFGINVFASLFGASGGAVVWILALIASWVLCWLGFYSLYKAGKVS